MAEGGERGKCGEGCGVCVLSWWGWRESTRSLPPRGPPPTALPMSVQKKTPHVCTWGTGGAGCGEWGVGRGAWGARTRSSSTSCRANWSHLIVAVRLPSILLSVLLSFVLIVLVICLLTGRVFHHVLTLYLQGLCKGGAGRCTCARVHACMLWYACLRASCCVSHTFPNFDRYAV